jgi:hypothetical protein
VRTTTFFSRVLVVVATLASSSSFPDDARNRSSPILFQRFVEDEDARETRSVAAREETEEESEGHDIGAFSFISLDELVRVPVSLRATIKMSQRECERCDDDE